MNLTLNPTLANLGGANERENGLAQYKGLLSGTFVETLPATAYAMRESANGTTEHEFYAVGRAQARSYTPGTPNQGQRRPIRERRTIPADNAMIRSDVIVGDLDKFLSHIPTMERVTNMQGHAVRVEYEKRVLRQLALGARQPARVSADDGGEGFDSGVLLRANAATLAAAFPVSLQGARNIEQKLQEAQEQLDSRNLGDSPMRIAHMGPYLKRVLMQNPALSNNVIRAPIGNSVIEYEMVSLAGFTIVFNNLMDKSNSRSAIPTTGTPATIDGESQYSLDTSETAILIQAHPESVAIADFQAPTGLIYRDEDRMSDISRVTSFTGVKWLEPAACVEIYCSTSDYVEGASGVFEPA